MRIMRLQHVQWILVTGVMWLSMGAYLLCKGLLLLMLAAYAPMESLTLLPYLQALWGNETVALILLTSLGLAIGFFKGRFVLAKTVRRIVGRIVSLPSPVSIKDVYTFSYIGLLGAMMALGIALRWAPISTDIRGFIDVAIGFALMNGAVLYFRKALTLRSQG